jgi:GAF domain-containing protein
VGIISFVDLTRSWYKSKRGIDFAEIPRDQSLCNYMMFPDSPEVLIVNDLTTDPRFCNNPLVTSGPQVRFYAAVVIVVNGVRVGTVCVVDLKPRDFDNKHTHTLRGFASQLENHLRA